MGKVGGAAYMKRKRAERRVKMSRSRSFSIHVEALEQQQRGKEAE